MTGKDASGRPVRGPWKNWLSLALGAAALIAVCCGVRMFWGPGRASADAPRAAQRAAARPVSQARPVSGTLGVNAQLSNKAAASAPAATAAAAPSAAPSPDAMAMVNGEQISRIELARECLKRYGEEVLASIVNKHLIWQACQQQGVQLTDQDVAAEVQRMASKWGLSSERYLHMLYEEREITPDQYRQEIIWPTLALRRLVAGELEVTPEELQQAFESEYGAKVQARMITVSSRAKADQLRAEAAAHPESFESLAKDHSEDPHSASARGVIPPIRKHLGDAHFERIAFALKEGEISSVIPVGSQYIILKCEKHLPETVVPAQSRVAIEQRLEDQVREQKMHVAAPKLFEQLEAKAQVVHVYNDPQKQQQHPGVAAIINGQPVTMAELGEECIARHGKDVLEGEINRKILQQELRRQNKTVSAAAIDAEIARVAEAYATKPDGSPDIEAWLKYITQDNGATVDLYVRDVVWPTVALKTLVEDRVQVSEEDLRKGFESNYGEMVEVLAIVLSNQRQAQEVWDMARNNPTDKFFGELAQQYSIEPLSRANFGKVPPVRQFGGQPHIEREAFRLEPGELSGILSVADKYIILRCLGRTKPVVEDLAAVKDELYKHLLEKKQRVAMVEELDRLKGTARVDNFLTGTLHSPKATAAAAARAAATPRAGTALAR